MLQFPFPCIPNSNSSTISPSLVDQPDDVPGYMVVCKQVTVCPGHIWTTLYHTNICKSKIYHRFHFYSFSIVSVTGVPNFMKILYKTFFLTENSSCTAPLYSQVFEKTLVTTPHDKTCYKTLHKASVKVQLHAFITSALHEDDKTHPQPEIPPHSPLNRRLHGPPSQSEPFGEQRNLLPVTAQTTTSKPSSMQPCHCTGQAILELQH